uniref:Uncharacterized protein n=1 Tax=Arundo donax TaxID=35708 RepID=A0A0A9H936_ARUDO
MLYVYTNVIIHTPINSLHTNYCKDHTRESEAPNIRHPKPQNQTPIWTQQPYQLSLSSPILPTGLPKLETSMNNPLDSRFLFGVSAKPK